MRIDVRLTPADLDAALRADVLTGLSSRPRSLPPKWFYDERGGQLFDDITRLPEYYPTRAETEILAAHAADVATLTGASHLVELGSGTSTKTRLLLDALQVRACTPFDVDEATLLGAAPELEAAYPGLAVHAVVGDFEHHLGSLPGGGGRLVAFLGSTIGNLEPPDRAKLLGTLASALLPGEWLLLGTDLVKDEATLVVAYDDAQGVTAEFNRNVLHVLNRRLHADFDVDAFRHRALWRPDEEWIEMRLVAEGDQQVRIADLDLDVHFADGEELRTEISAKFRREGVEAELASAGFDLTRWWTDAEARFALSLSRRT
jgi:L-histidine N-alpha-methyltransferase